VDSAALTPLLGFGGVVIGAVLTFLGVRFAARQSAKAALSTAMTNAAVADRQVDVEEWKAIVESLRNELTRLTGRVESLEARRETDRTLIESLESDLRSRESRYRALVSYARELLVWTRHPADLPPPPPATFADELSI
jgi:hypothetical protein